MTAAFCHRTRLTTWQASYAEYVITFPQFLSNQNLNATYPVPIGGPVPTNEVITTKLAQGSANLHYSKTFLTLTGFHADTKYQLSGAQEVLGWTANWGWRFARHTSSQLTFGWQTIDNRPVLQPKFTSDFTFVAVGLYRTITPHLNTGLSYWHMEQTANEASNRYSDDRVTASMFITF
ncbi:hypothetical protein [Candidatus Methylocalor cossyra]|uniref:Uncharacterized protein n=1 Tax=Candidatus Methylocalor cossyra TaxID=3108543 RepID=A0ABP1C5X2_9GAMM